MSSAPGRAAVFEALAAQLLSYSCRGSRADALETRCSLVQQFLSDHHPRVRGIARRPNESMSRDMEEERARETNRDERFE